MTKDKRPRKRKSPTAPELPPPVEQPRALPARVPAHAPPALVRFVAALRVTVGAILDVADAAAEAITRRLQQRP